MSVLKALSLAACLAASPEPKAPPPPSAEPPPPPRSGSLYDPATFRAPAADSKAFRVGDVITVQVLERSSAATSTDTATRRTNDLEARAGVTPGQPVGASLSVRGDFDGGGETQRTNKLLATVTVSIVEILPNGDLRLAGSQLLTVNDEKHTVSVEGRVRPRDVSGDNVVLSPRLADARILYSGEGELSRRQRPGFWRRLLDLVGF